MHTAQGTVFGEGLFYSAVLGSFHLITSACCNKEPDICNDSWHWKNRWGYMVIPAMDSEDSFKILWRFSFPFLKFPDKHRTK